MKIVSESPRAKFTRLFLKTKTEAELAQFLQTEQTDFRGMTGGEMLQSKPEELLAALEEKQRLDAETEELLEALRLEAFEERAAR